MTSLRFMSREKLLTYSRKATADERSAHARLIAALRENIRRQLFKEMGYRSLHAFIVQELGYDGGSASRRANAAYAAMELETVSDVKKQIASGDLSMSSLSHVNQLFKQEKYEAKRKVGLKEKKKILQAVSGKSEREVQKSLSQFRTVPLPKFKSREEVISRTQTRIEMQVDDQFYAEIQEAMNLLSHVNPRMDHLELYQYLVRDYLKRKSPFKKVLKTKKEASKNKRLKGSAPNQPIYTKTNHKTEVHKSEVHKSEVQKRTQEQKAACKRHPTQAHKQEVIQRDGPGCSYIDPISKKRCNSRHQSQIDHIHPWSLGGGTHAANLRILCAIHNRYLYQSQQQFLPLLSRRE